jgi:hypothetical protein
MTDERSIKALDVSERYANGLATDEELAAAWAAASDAAWEAARAAQSEEFLRIVTDTGEQQW